MCVCVCVCVCVHVFTHLSVIVDIYSIPLLHSVTSKMISERLDVGKTMRAEGAVVTIGELQTIILLWPATKRVSRDGEEGVGGWYVVFLSNRGERGYLLLGEMTLFGAVSVVDVGDSMREEDKHFAVQTAEMVLEASVESKTKWCQLWKKEELRGEKGRDRERQRETERDRERQRETEREGVNL